jgi:hypothetical protein
LSHIVGEREERDRGRERERERKKRRGERERETEGLVKACRHVRRECMECVGRALLPRDQMEGAAVLI